MTKTSSTRSKQKMAIGTTKELVSLLVRTVSETMASVKLMPDITKLFLTIGVSFETGDGSYIDAGSFFMRVPHSTARKTSKKQR